MTQTLNLIKNESNELKTTVVSIAASYLHIVWVKICVNNLKHKAFNKTDFNKQFLSADEIKESENCESPKTRKSWRIAKVLNF